jgi:hypothetical protein
VLLTVPKPESNHNGGQLAFGQDVSLCRHLDGGGAAMPGTIGNGQERTLGRSCGSTSTHGQWLGYAIPAGNPFSANALRRYGSGSSCRNLCLGSGNPWRFSFDRTGGGCGSAAPARPWEEIDRIARPGIWAGAAAKAHAFNANCGPGTALIEPVSNTRTRWDNR